MRKKRSAFTKGWLAGVGVIFLMLLGSESSRAQSGNFQSELSLGWQAGLAAASDSTGYAALTYFDDGVGSVVMVSKTGAPCQPHLGGVPHRNPNRQRSPRKANGNRGRKSLGSPCQQQPIVKLRRRGGRGRQI